MTKIIIEFELSRDTKIKILEDMKKIDHSKMSAYKSQKILLTQMQLNKEIQKDIEEGN